MSQENDPSLHFNDLQVNYLGGINDLASVKNIVVDLPDGESALKPEDAVVLAALPEYILFDIKRYQNAIERISETTDRDLSEIVSMSRLINVGLEYYVEPHEIPEILDEIIVEELKSNEDLALGCLTFFKGSELAGFHIKLLADKMNGVLVIMLEDLIAALIGMKVPSINGISAPYRFDAFSGSTLVLRKSIENAKS